MAHLVEHVAVLIGCIHITCILAKHAPTLTTVIQSLPILVYAVDMSKYDIVPQTKLLGLGTVRAGSQLLKGGTLHVNETVSAMTGLQSHFRLALPYAVTKLHRDRVSFLCLFKDEFRRVGLNRTRKHTPYVSAPCVYSHTLLEKLTAV
jgi:hypothetical protein